MRFRIRFGLFSLGALLLSLPGFAASRMIFPRVVFQNQRSVGFAIANPTSAAATVTLKAYNPDGSLFAGTGVTNPATKQIAAGAQFAVVASELFTPPASMLSSTTPTRLWVEVTSPTDGLTGFFLEFNDRLDFIDGTDVREMGTDLIVPLVENVSPTSTELLIVNPNGSDASLAVDLISPSGSYVAEGRALTVPKLGALQGPIATFINLDYQSVAALRVRSNVPIVCYADIFRQSDTSFVTVPGMDASAPSKTLYFPQLAEGDGWKTVVGVANLDRSRKVLATITAYDENGNVFALGQMTNPVSREIPANGVLRESARSLFNFASSPLQVGWIKVEATDTTIVGYVEYSAGTNRAFVAAQVTPFQSSIFSHQVLVSPYFTGIAVLNPGSVARSYEIVSLDSSGRVNGKAQRVLRPGQKEAKLIQQIIPAADGKAGGAVFLKADGPLIATQLFGTSDFSALANVPPQQVTTGFNPGSEVARITVTPPLAVVETGKNQTFLSAGGSGLIWQVEGSAGNDTVGTITAGGVYRAPAKAPSKKAVTVQAVTASGDRSGAATIDVVQREALTGGLTLVTSVAYLESVQRFYIAEQLVLSSAPGTRREATTNNARISVVTAAGGTPSQLISPIANEIVSKMVPFVDSGSSYLLLAGFESGKIYRLNVDSKQLATVVSGLNKPNSMTIDPISGDLFVSESGANQIIAVTRSQILAASEPGTGPEAADQLPRRWAGLPVTGPQGVAVDGCSGKLYYTTADGALQEYDNGRTGSRPVVTGLNRPTHLQALYRDGLGCAEGLTLAVVEQNRISLVYPLAKSFQPLISSTLAPVDLTFFPKNNPFTGAEASIVFAESGGATLPSQISRVPVGGIYQAIAPEKPAGASATGSAAMPYEDPEKDTFATAQSAGRTVHDILSVNAHRMSGSVVITIRLKEAASPISSGLPNGLSGIIFVDQTPGGTGQPGEGIDPNLLNPLRLVEQIGFESIIDLENGYMFSFGTFQQYTVAVTYAGNVISVAVPEAALTLATAKIEIVVSNQAEATDIAPNSGGIKLIP